jgi:GAF domain-containing protein
MHWLSLKELLSWNPLHIKEKQFGSAKIRFDNAFRFWISTSSVLVLFGLWLGGVLPAFLPVLSVFLIYGVVQLGASFALRHSRHARAIDFVVCGVDMVALSAAVYWTGGATSPLYFIYFVPLVIQAFHRDWILILYYGFGGVFLYSVAVLFSVADITPSNFLDLGARLFFMLMTVSITALAVNLLRKRDEAERVRLSRMKFLTHISELFCHVNVMSDLPGTVEKLVTGLNAELAPQLNSWSRVFLRESDSHFMNAHVEPGNDRPELARELATDSCPVMAKGKPFYYGDDTQSACPTESFSFKSHLCLPIAGTDGETYGVLFSASEIENAFREDEIKFLEFIATTVGLTVQRLNRVEDLDLATEMNSCAVATFMGSTHGLAQTYEALVDGLSRIAQTDQVSLMVWDPAAGLLKTVLVRGHFEGQEARLFCHMGEGVPGKVLETGESTLQNEIVSAPSLPGPVPYKSWLAIPIRSMRGEPLGVLNAWSFDPLHLSSRRMDMALTFATRAAIAVENALEREKLAGSAKRDGLKAA